MSNASLIANSQTMLDNGSLFSNTDITRILSALMVAESELVASRAAIQRVLNLVGDPGPEARRILTAALGGGNRGTRERKALDPVVRLGF